MNKVIIIIVAVIIVLISGVIIGVIIQEHRKTMIIVQKARKVAVNPQHEITTTPKTVATNSDNAIFEHILNVFFSFKNTCPNKIVSLSIFPSIKERGHVAFDISFIFDGNVSYCPSNETSEMLALFEMIEDDGHFQTFECVYNTFEHSTNYDYISQQLKSSVKLYMAKNPNIKFDLSGKGACIKYW